MGTDLPDCRSSQLAFTKIYGFAWDVLQTGEVAAIESIRDNLTSNSSKSNPNRSKHIIQKIQQAETDETFRSNAENPFQKQKEEKRNEKLVVKFRIFISFSPMKAKQPNSK